LLKPILSNDFRTRRTAIERSERRKFTAARRFFNASSQLAAPERQRRRVAGDAVLIAPVSTKIPC
jgi:hypothetical protein